MEFLIIICVVGFGLYFLNQNKTEKKDRTTITHKKIIQTDDGEIHIERKQVIDSVRTSYTKDDLAQNVIKNIAPVIEHEPVNKIIDSEKMKTDNKIQELELIPSPKPETQIDLFLIKNEDTKMCLKCSNDLSFDNFARSAKNEDGMTKWCISCLNQSTKERKSQSSNKKYCPNCQKNRLKSSFLKNSKQPDGLTKWCKDCMNKSRK